MDNDDTCYIRVARVRLFERIGALEIAQFVDVINISQVGHIRRGSAELNCQCAIDH